MARMYDIRRTAKDVKAEKKASGKDDDMAYVAPEDEGARVDLDHHHLTKMGLNGDLKSGDEGEIRGRFTVEKSESRSTPDGDKHSATIRIHRAGVDHEPANGEDDARSDLRGEIEKNAADKDGDKD